MCIAEITPAPKGRNFYQDFADQLLLSAYTCVLENGSLGVAPKDQRLQRFARPVVAASTHMCVAKQIESRLHPRVEILSGLRRPTATVSIHTCVAEWITWSCTQRSKVTRVRPTSCCSEHTHVRCKTNRITAAPKGRNSFRASPTNCYCQHTHVCCRMDHLELHPKTKGYKGSPDQLLQRAYTCALQNKSNQGCAQGSTRVRPTSSCWHAHVARFRTDEFKVAPKVKGSKIWPTNCCLEHTHTHTRVLQNMSIQGCARGSRVTRFGRPRTHIVRAHVPCRIDQTRAAPTDRELQRFGRATADVSIHMCVAECINSGLHPRVKGYNGVADQLLQ